VVDEIARRHALAVQRQLFLQMRLVGRQQTRQQTAQQRIEMRIGIAAVAARVAFACGKYDSKQARPLRQAASSSGLSVACDAGTSSMKAPSALAAWKYSAPSSASAVSAKPVHAGCGAGALAGAAALIWLRKVNTRTCVSGSAS
jgi:hypothetical protein